MPSFSCLTMSMLSWTNQWAIWGSWNFPASSEGIPTFLFTLYTKFSITIQTSAALSCLMTAIIGCISKGKPSITWCKQSIWNSVWQREQRWLEKQGRCTRNLYTQSMTINWTGNPVFKVQKLSSGRSRCGESAGKSEVFHHLPNRQQVEGSGHQETQLTYHNSHHHCGTWVVHWGDSIRLENSV